MRIRIALLLALVVFVVTPVVGQKRNITEKDLFNFIWIGDPQVSPDGSRIAFVRVTVNDRKDGYNTAIWTVATATGETRQLTSGIRDSSPRWSPDGKYLCFVRVTEKDGRPDQPQLFMLSMEGGEAFQFTSLARGVSGPQWSSDGKMISFYNGATAEELAKAAPKTSPSPSPSPAASPKPEEHESDVRVITRAVYRSNGAGYVDNKHPQHIWVVTAPRTGEDKVTPRQLTNGRYDAGNVVWAKDNSQLYFVSNHSDEPYYELPSTDIYTIQVSGGTPSKLTTFDMGAGALALSPDGKKLTFCASTNKPVQSYTEPDLWVMDASANAQPKNLTKDFNFDVCSGVGGDNTAPRSGGGNPPIWSADGRRIFVTFAKEGKANVGAFDATTGRETDVTSGNQAVVNVRAVPDASKFALLISTPTRIGDLYWLEGSSGTPKQLTHINDELFSKLNLTEPEEIWYTMARRCKHGYRNHLTLIQTRSIR
jgi:dipeptidyl aminopeptidase/acylaminoacyl peptidase